MSKTYQIKSLDAKGQPQIETIQPAPGRAPTVIKAVPGTRYTLTEVQQGSAPDNIRVQRSGKHLRIMFDGSSQPDVVIEDFFDGSPSGGKSTLTGTTDRGALHEYVPETGIEQHSLSRLEDNDAIHGMALGGIEVPANTGAAVGLLAPLAGGGLGIGAAGAGAAALGAAALAGGGGGGGGDTAPAKPKIEFLALATTSDSGPVGDNITKVQRPTIVGKATANSEVTVTLNNKTYTTTADANGDFTVTVSDTDLSATRYTPLAKATTANGVSSDTFSGTPFIVDLSSGDNINASGKPESDVNAGATLGSLVLSDDSGQAGDLVTSGQRQQFSGLVSAWTDNGDKVLVKLNKLGDNTTTREAYLTPNAQNQWTWDQSALPLDPGKYEVRSTLVDGAGNEVRNSSGSSISRTDTITISPGNGQVVNPDGSLTEDPNSTKPANAVISSLSNDTGVDNSDFITNDNTLVFRGLLENFTSNGDMLRVQLKNRDGAIVHSGYVKPTGNAWTWDLSTRQLPDGPYELTTTIVDAGGTQVSGTTQAIKALVVDTSVSKNQTPAAQAEDANSALQLLSMDMADTDKITNSTTPAFNGTFGSGKTWTSNGDIFKFEIHDLAGHVIDLSPQLSNGSNSWTSAAWTNPLTTDGTYIAKASILDAAGNVLNTVQQAFTLDKTAPSLLFTETVKDIALEGSAFSNGLTVSRFSLSSNEAVHYTIKTGSTLLAEGDYNGSATYTNNTINGSFNAGEFTVIYTDAAGNTSQYTNTDRKLVFSNIILTTSAPTHGYTDLPTPLGKLGAVGTIKLDTADQMLDLTSIIGNGQLHNHIDMSPSGSQHLTLNLNDVLHLGAVNSFRVDDLLQFRVDGGTNDTVVFKDRSAWALEPTTVDIGANHYAVYSSYDTNHHLVEVMVQQGIQIS